MATPSYLRSPFRVTKRLKICPTSTLQQRTHATHRSPFLDMLKDDFDNVNDAAKSASLSSTIARRLYLTLIPEPPALPSQPPRNPLTILSTQISPLTLAADFAMRAAYYLHLPAKGPVPLPRITERWTVPRSNFVHKKSQENFERVTVRRLVQIQDGDAEVVKAWLGFLMKYCVSGVGMKANIWEHEGVGEKRGVEEIVKEVEQGMEGRWNLFGRIGRGVGPEHVASSSADEAVMEAVRKQLGGVEIEEVREGVEEKPGTAAGLSRKEHSMQVRSSNELPPTASANPLTEASTAESKITSSEEPSNKDR
ncbi:MAG: hypothetical protein Q9165_004661 [Trypethelium subeluteriae]